MTRTDAGYRLYDDRTLARLAFIKRAKQLGGSLEEVIDLVAIWDGERCAPVQRRFHELVTAKIGEAQRQLAELTGFAAQLQTAAAHLASPPVDGPCDDDCACVSHEPDASTNTSLILGSAPAGPPIACTLEAAAMPDRLVHWQDILGHARSRSATADGGVRVEFDDGVALDELVRVAAAEQRCCAFFSFALTIDARGVALEVRAPDEGHDVVAALFGRPS